jgi:uncharacterized repeat protein (TIGR01451 family)
MFWDDILEEKPHSDVTILNSAELHFGRTQHVPGGGWLEYVVRVTNDSDCTATNVKVDDLLPHSFSCGGAFFLTNKGAQLHLHMLKCEGTGRTVFVDVGSLPPHHSVHIEIFGGFVREGPTKNDAHAQADNADAADSNPVHVDVVSDAKFEHLKRELQHKHH